MNYNSPQLLDQLAAAYALGSMRGRARARFERLCETLPAVRAARHSWEDRLLPLAIAVPKVAPSSILWSSIRSRVQLDAGVPTRGGARAGSWRWAVAAAIVTITLLIGRFTIWNEPSWQVMSTLAQANSAPMWQVERTADFSRLMMRAQGTLNPPPGRSYELWVIPAAGGTPVSLGLLPTSGNLDRAMNDNQRRLLQTAMTVAVTVEVAGGSPNGLPTGTPIIAAPITTA
jgi:anti-sigma-K factor RskA